MKRIISLFVAVFLLSTMVSASVLPSIAPCKNDKEFIKEHQFPILFDQAFNMMSLDEDRVCKITVTWETIFGETTCEGRGSGENACKDAWESVLDCMRRITDAINELEN